MAEAIHTISAILRPASIANSSGLLHLSGCDGVLLPGLQLVFLAELVVHGEHCRAPVSHGGAALARGVLVACRGEHFYLVWPRLVRILSRRTLAIVCAALMVFEPVLR